MGVGEINVSVHYHYHHGGTMRHCWDEPAPGGIVGTSWPGQRQVLRQKQGKFVYR